jgi:hypothetical protein
MDHSKGKDGEALSNVRVRTLEEILEEKRRLSKGVDSSQPRPVIKRIAEAAHEVFLANLSV